MKPQSRTPYKVTLHAIEQFISRGAKERPYDKTAERILRNIGKAQEVVQNDATLSLLNNGGKEARLFSQAPLYLRCCGRCCCYVHQKPHDASLLSN